jgi:hypothetical protein
MEAYDISVLENGVYFLKIFSTNGFLHIKEVLKN